MSKFDINEAFIKALQEQEEKECAVAKSKKLFSKAENKENNKENSMDKRARGMSITKSQARDLGYEDTDPMIMVRDENGGTVLKPVKVKKTKKYESSNMEFVNAMLNKNKEEIENFLGYKINDKLFNNKQKLKLAIEEVYEQMPDEELSKFECKKENKKLEETLDEAINRAHQEEISAIDTYDTILSKTDETTDTKLVDMIEEIKADEEDHKLLLKHYIETGEALTDEELKELKDKEAIEESKQLKGNSINKKATDISITKHQAKDLYDWFLEGDDSVGVFKFNNKLNTFRVNNNIGTPEPIYNDTADYVIDIVDYMKEMTPYYIKSKRDGIDTVYNYVNDEIQSNEEESKNNVELNEALGSPKDSYWEGKGKYQDLTKLINDKLLPAEGTDAKVSGIIPENLFKQYVILQNKYYRFYNDGELPFRKTSVGWNATKSGLDRDFKNQFNDDIDKPVLAQVGTDLENKMNSLIEKILKAVPDLEEKLNNIGKESKNEEVEYISKKELDDMPDDYKTTVKDTINTEVNYHGKDRAKVTKMYKDLGYDGDDPMILASEKGGTVLKPVKVKEESKLNEDIEIVDSEQGTETITDLHTDLFRLVNMYQYGIGDDVVCSREQLDEVMRKYAEPIISDAFKYALPSAEVEFTRFEHPEYYRAFTNLNDQLFFNVTFDKSEYERLKEETLNDDYFFEYLKDNYSSYDGFISYMATDRDEFNNQEDWRQFVQVIQYNMPEFTEEQYNQFLYDVEEELYSEYDTDRAIIEYAEENMPSDTENIEQWVRDNFNIPEDFDIDYIVDEIKDIVKDTTSDVDKTERKEENKKVKTEDLIDMGDLRDSIDTDDLIEDEDEDEEDDYGETISLLGIAYRDIPEVGVEDWGKGDELYFCLDTKKLLSYLEDYEVEIPKYLVDNDDEPVDTYLSDYLGINPNDCEFDNSYNWGSRLTHDLEIATYTSKEDDNFYVKMSVHREGDVRGNYTTDFLLRFDDEDTFYSVMLDAQLSCANTFEFEGKKYWVEPHIFDEHVDISVEGGEKDWSDVYCENLDQLKEIISENSEE